MSLPKRNSKAVFSQDAIEDSDYLNHFEELEPDYFSYPSALPSGDNFQNLSKSDYAKVIFCDLYYNIDSTVGCKFQITDNVHEDPCDYIGLFRVGYDNLSQCLASKMLSQTDCEDDGKLLRCTFKPSELPELENGFYQFLYITRDKEVCGASMPFQIKNSITKGLSSDEDIVADNSEDDFLVVRSNMAEKNRRLQALLDEMTEKCLKHESEMRKIHEKLKIVSEEKSKIEHLLKQACDEKIELFNEARKVKKEKSIMCEEKEEAIRILREKNKVFSSLFENYSEKLKEFADLKEELLADKNRALTENVKLQDRIKKLTESLEKKQIIIDQENEKKEALVSTWNKEISKLTSQLDDAKLMIEALEKNKQLSHDEIVSLTERVVKLQEQLKDTKCEKLILETKLSESAIELEKNEKEMQHMKSEITVLKLHILDLHGAKPPPSVCEGTPPVASGSSSRIPEETSSEHEKELSDMKCQCAKLESELKEKDDTILKLKEEIVKVNGVVEYLTKEKESVQKSGSLLQDALGECILRLNEGSELYKKQFRKIEKLRKKYREIKEKDKKQQVSDKVLASAPLKDSCSSAPDSADEIASDVKLSPNQNSDSDTGEHLLRHPASVEKKKTPELRIVKDTLQSACEIISPAKAIALSACHQIESLVGAVGNGPSTSKIREVPELQTLIEMNLEKFNNSQAKEDEVLYSIPCPVCDQDVGVYISSTDEMVKHLEIQHKQQVCPICGRLFDMTLPAKYFQYHVEDHFVKEIKQ